MDFQPPDLPDIYTTLNIIIETINIFASLQSYVIIKKRTKVSKKRDLRNTILICDQSKEYYSKNWSKKLSTRKTDCPFDGLVV